MLRTKILVPLDGSELSSRILSFVDRMPQRQAFELILLSTFREVPTGSMAQCKEEFHDLLKSVFKSEETMRAGGSRCSSVLTRGEYAAESILHMIDVIQPALVAMSTHGKGGKLSTVRGGVAEQIVRRCPVPLLLGNSNSLPFDPGGGFVKVLVPVDGSQTSARILGEVTDLALSHGSEVVLFTVQPDGSPDTSELEPLVDRLKAAGVERVRAKAAVGDAAAEILEAVSREGADLLAMTSHARPDPRGRFFGSVAEQVIGQCDSALLLLRISGPS